MNVRFVKAHPQAKVPTKAHKTDAGFDLTAVSVEPDPASNIITYDTGIVVDIPEGYAGLVYARSSIYKTGQIISNGVGVIDAGYHGTIKVKTYLADNNVNHPIAYHVGDRIAQLIIIPLPEVNFTEVDHVDESDRGEGGYGSTGK